MALFIYLLIGALFSIALFVLWKLQKYGICALLVLVIIGLVSFVIGGYASAAVDRYSAPYYFFDAKKIRSEHIKVERYESGKYFFSNGESFSVPKSLTHKVVWRLVFVLVAGILLLLGRVLVLLLSRKSFPELHIELAPYLLGKK